MEDELRSHFPEYSDRKIINIGAPQFDGHTDPSNIIPREEFCYRLGLDSKRPIILYCTGGPHICRNEHLLIKELQDTIQELSKVMQPQLLIRLHPYFWNTDLRVYENIRGAAIWPKQEDVPQMLGGSTTGLLDDYRMMLSSFYHQAVNVNVASTVTLDSMIFDRPVINIKYDGPQKLPRSLRVKRVYQYDHYRHIANSGAVQLVCNRKALTSAVLQALQEPDRQSAARHQVVRLECGSVDGYAGKRLAEALTQVPVSCATTKPVSATAKALAAALQT
jgi:CDP-glycerol glycerophosphotransferase (TagB/SpsB family)